MEPFRIDVATSVIEDLHDRLDRVRWPTEPVAAPWLYGTDLAWMQEVARHWRHEYDWRRWEARLNGFSNFRASIGGRKVHFILEKGSGENPLPLLLTHGWPGSVVEFIDVIDRLAHPQRHGGRIEDAFSVVVPHLPGYGFSEPPAAPITPQDIAGLWHELMTQTLGFPRYVAQGGDWGGIVTAQLALHHPDRLAAIHLNISALQPAADPAQPWTAEERDWMERDATRRVELSGYRFIQGTKPQTLAYGLTDSPIGLAAWILEKFHDWTVRGDPGPPPFDLDHLLTNVMLYWINGINAANWLYVSLIGGTGRSLPPGRRVEVPTGFMLCPNDLGELPPDSWLRRGFNMVHRVDAEKGGHFLALEQDQVFVDEVRSFFAAYR